MLARAAVLAEAVVDEAAVVVVELLLLVTFVVITAVAVVPAVREASVETGATNPPEVTVEVSVDHLRVVMVVAVVMEVVAMAEEAMATHPAQEASRLGGRRLPPHLQAAAPRS